MLSRIMEHHPELEEEMELAFRCFVEKRLAFTTSCSLTQRGCAWGCTQSPGISSLGIKGSMVANDASRLEAAVEHSQNWAVQTLGLHSFERIRRFMNCLHSMHAGSKTLQAVLPLHLGALSWEARPAMKGLQGVL